MAQQHLLEQSRALSWTPQAQTIVRAEDAAQSLFMIQSGYVRLYQHHLGREITMNVLGSGEMFGCRTLLANQTYGLYVDVLTDVQVLALDHTALHALMRRFPELGGAVTAQLCRQSRSLQNRLSQLVFLEVSQRLALALLSLLEQANPTKDGAVLLQERISHQDLAYAIGSTRETITKVLGEFRTRGLLELGYRRIIITDRQGLLEAAKSPVYTV